MAFTSETTTKACAVPTLKAVITRSFKTCGFYFSPYQEKEALQKRTANPQVQPSKTTPSFLYDHQHPL
jgi:hypothetical protein